MGDSGPQPPPAIPFLESAPVAIDVEKLKHYHKLGMSYADLAHIFGVSRQRCHQIAMNVKRVNRAKKANPGSGAVRGHGLPPSGD